MSRFPQLDGRWQMADGWMVLHQMNVTPFLNLEPRQRSLVVYLVAIFPDILPGIAIGYNFWAAGVVFSDG